MKILILGNGAFGSVMASYLKKQGHKVLPESEISKAEAIFVSLPYFAVVPELLKLKNKITKSKIIICSKGFSNDGELLSEALKKKLKNKIFFLYGPTLAHELKEGVFSGMVLSGPSGKEKLKKELESESLHIELSEDVVGVQIGSGLKNAVTIFVGIAEGAKYGDNTKAYIFTKGVCEIAKIGKALGGDMSTFLGLTCIGDLTLHSRNRSIGVEIGKGKNIRSIIGKLDYVPEGIVAVQNIKILGIKKKIKMPIMDILYKIIFGGMSPSAGVEMIKKLP